MVFNGVDSLTGLYLLTTSSFVVKDAKKMQVRMKLCALWLGKKERGKKKKTAPASFPSQFFFYLFRFFMLFGRLTIVVQ